MDQIENVFKCLPRKNAKEPMISRGEIAKQLGLEPPVVAKCLKRLEADGRAVREGEKRGTKWGRA